MSEAHEDAIQAAKDPAKADQKEKPAESGVAAVGHAVSSLMEALTALGKLVLVVAILIVLWNKRTAVENYVTQWLESANKLGFLGLSIERQTAAKATIGAIANSKNAVINADYARGAVTRAARNAPAIVGARILWVDDNPPNNKLEREVLETIGIEVFLAKDTKEALTLLPLLRPDLVLSDVTREKDQKLPLRNCPAHFFQVPRNATGDLATFNSDLMAGNSRYNGFSMAEAISAIDAKFTDRASPRIIFYSASTGGLSASQCARLVTNRTDVLLHAVVSALEERRWEKLKDQPATETKR
jgi:CheY-like chemotaxis protein